MDKRKELKQIYKDHPPETGVFQIKNTVNGKIFLGSAMNLPGKINGQQFQLRQGSHYNETLQKEWNQFGAEAFSFEIIDILKPQVDQSAIEPADLKALEDLWLEKLRPFGEKGYNSEKGTGRKPSVY